MLMDIIVMSTFPSCNVSRLGGLIFALVIDSHGQLSMAVGGC